MPSIDDVDIIIVTMAVENKWTPHLPGVVLLTTRKIASVRPPFEHEFWFWFWFWRVRFMREKETSPFLYFYFYSFWFLDHDTWASRIDTWHRKDLSHMLSQQKKRKNFSKRRRRQAAHGSIDITSSLDICEGGLIPRRHKEGHIRQLSNWDAWGVSRLGQEKGW